MNRREFWKLFLWSIVTACVPWVKPRWRNVLFVVAKGEWSNPKNWSTGKVPGRHDNVYANGNTVIVDSVINVKSLNNVARHGARAGGGFVYRGSSDFVVTAERGVYSTKSGSVLISNCGPASMTIAVSNMLPDRLA